MALFVWPLNIVFCILAGLFLACVITGLIGSWLDGLIEWVKRWIPYKGNKAQDKEREDQKCDTTTKS